MKALIILFCILTVSHLTHGMGYPQDMFAEHTVEKTSAKKESQGKKKVRQRATKATGVKKECTDCKQPLKANNASEPRRAGLHPHMVYQGGKIDRWVAWKQIDASNGCVNESAFPATEFIERYSLYQNVAELLSQLCQHRSHCFS